MQLTLNLVTLFIAITMISCIGQPSVGPNQKVTTPVSYGDTIQTLGNNIMVVYQDQKQVYWFGSWETGLYRYDGKTIRHFTKKHGLPANRVESIQEDKSGNLFFYTTGGICQYDGARFSTLSISEGTNYNMFLNPDDIWFKSPRHADEVFRFDGNTLHPFQIPLTKSGEVFLSKNQGSSPINGVYSIYKDRKGNVWFGTAALGVCRYDGITIDWIDEADVTEMHNGPSNGVRSMVEDKHGDFWFNTDYRYRVYGRDSLVDNKTNSEKFYTRIKSIGSLDGKKGGDQNEFLSITMDNNNALWIATYINGVWQVDGEKVQHYPVMLEGKPIKIFCIYKDRNGDLWLGTLENGAYKFNGKTFERFGD